MGVLLGGHMSADTAVAAEAPTRRQGASFTYDAFFSYNHQDGAVAAGIQKGLHRIGRRMGQLNALRVFRGCKSCSVASLNNLGLEKKLNDPFSAGHEACGCRAGNFGMDETFSILTNMP
jgi:hypothetical protein